jgi:broad specificity phosphatase PhoE
MIRILLVRHGSTDLLGRVLYGRMPGVHLNADGFRQARAVGRVLKQRFQMSEVVSSPMERAIETAQSIAEPQSLAVSLDEDVNEIDFGSWKGLQFGELNELDGWKRYNKMRSTSSPPHGEFATQVQTRAWSALDRILRRHAGEQETTVSVVTHGDVIRALLILLLGMPLDHIHRLEIAPASVSEILITAGQPIVRTVNETFEQLC